MKIRVLALGDLVGAAGRAMLQKHLPKLCEQYAVDMVVVNGENSSAKGKGITPKIMHFFQHVGVNMVTTGNHIWQAKEILPYLAEHKDLLRPANFPGGCPGSGVGTFTTANNVTVGVINVQGRTFMKEFVSCPFRAAESALTFLKSRTNLILVDMHAEATSEKIVLAHFLDGQVSAVWGTHTHVQTADERILPRGTAFITDLGMGGALNSAIGVKKESVLQHMLTQMPTKFEVDVTGPFVLSGVCIEIDVQTGKAMAITRVRVIDDELQVSPEKEEKGR